MSAETYVPDIPDQPMPDAQRAGAGGRCKDTWDVKSLLAKKVVRGKEEFIVEWEGFPKGGDIKGGPKGGPSWTEGAQFREQSVLAGTLNQFERSHESATRPHLFGTSSVFVAPTGVIGTGLFASVDFTSGDEVGRLLQYGVVPDNVVPPESEGYNFAVPGRPGLSIMPYPLKKSWHGWQEDALVHANHASTPNAELVYRKGVCAEMPLIKLVAIADIGEGYEIRFSYEADDVGGYGASAEETTVEEYAFEDGQKYGQSHRNAGRRIGSQAVFGIVVNMAVKTPEIAQAQMKILRGHLERQLSTEPCAAPRRAELGHS